MKTEAEIRAEIERVKAAYNKAADANNRWVCADEHLRLTALEWVLSASSAPASPEDTEVHSSSGDVFWDLGVDPPNEKLRELYRTGRKLRGEAASSSPVGEELDGLYELFQGELWTGCDAKAALRVALAQARAKALEEAIAEAKAVWRRDEGGGERAALKIMDAIHALKDRPHE